MKRILIGLLSLLATAHLLAAPPTYNFYPPPGMTWTQGLGQFTQNGPSTVSSNAGTSSVLGQNLDQTNTGNVLLAVGAPCGVTSGNLLTGYPCLLAGTSGTINNATLYIGAGGGANSTIIIFDTGTFAGTPGFSAGSSPGFVTDAGILDFETVALGSKINFFVHNSTGAVNQLLFSGDNDSIYTIGNTTGTSSDGSWRIQNHSTVAQGTTNFAVQTAQGSANPGLLDMACTSNAGTLAANGSGPGPPNVITGAPATVGCVIQWTFASLGTSTPLIFSRGGYVGGWLSNGFHLNTGAAGNNSNDVIFFNTAPTISSGFGTGASVPSNAGPYSFSVNVGTGGVASSGVIALPTAGHGWACSVHDVTTPTTNFTDQTASATNSVTVTNFVRTTGVAGAWTASDILELACMPN